MRPAGDPALYQRRREKAIAMLRNGDKPVVVARTLGVDRRSVRRWHAAFRAGGFGGIAARHNTGRPCRLKPPMKAHLQRELLKGALAAGFATDLWTCSRVAHVIKSRIGISYHVNHVCRLLRRLGWTPQKPQRRAVERDDAAVQNWIRRDWPRIKKKPGA